MRSPMRAYGRAITTATLRTYSALHSEVARSIAEEVGVKLTVDEKKQLKGAPSTRPEALEAYFRGLYHFNRDEVTDAIELGREAVRADAQMAGAHELLGLGLLRGADINRWHYAAISAEVRSELNRALELDPGRGGALAGLGWLILVSEHDFDRSESLMRRGSEVNPTNDSYANWLVTKEGLTRVSQSNGRQ